MRVVMGELGAIGDWISSNESLLSGMAAMIVLAGVIVSPLGIGARRLIGGRAKSPSEMRSRSDGSEDADASARSAPSPRDESRPERISFMDLTAPSPYETRFASSDGIRIAYNERGTGPPDLILAPGIISHLNITAHLPSTRDSIESLARFARVISFDKRGQGLSDPTLHAPNLEERTRDIEAVMDAAGVERAILMGVSEGGPMCVHFAYTHPDRVQGLILFGSTASWVQREDFPIGIPRKALELLTSNWGKGVARDIFFPGLSREQVDDDTYRAFERTIATRDTVRGLVSMMVETDVRDLLPEIRVPTLVLHFSGDLAVPIRLGRALAEGLPNAEFMEINAVDHGDLSHSAEAVERVRQFCLEHAGPEAGAT